MHALIVQENHPAALDIFHSVCAMYVVRNDAMRSEMLKRVPVLIAAGASEHDLVNIPSANDKTAAALARLLAPSVTSLVRRLVHRRRSVRSPPTCASMKRQLRLGADQAVLKGAGGTR